MALRKRDKRFLIVISVIVGSILVGILSNYFPIPKTNSDFAKIDVVLNYVINLLLLLLVWGIVELAKAIILWICEE